MKRKNKYWEAFKAFFATDYEYDWKEVLGGLGFSVALVGLLVVFLLAGQQ